jgi:hypothetical protein
MDKNKFWLGGRLFNTASPRLGTPTQCKARPQDGRINATQGTSASWAPQCNTRHVHKLGAPMHVHKMGTQTQHKARPQVVCPNATQGTSASWVPQRTSATQTQGTSIHPQVGRRNTTKGMSACPQVGHPNVKLIRNENVHRREHYAKRRAGGWIRKKFGLEVDFLIQPHQGWFPQRNARHVRNLGTPTQRKARPQVGCPNARPQRKRKARLYVRKLGAPTQHKARPQVGRPNATQGEFARWAPK